MRIKRKFVVCRHADYLRLKKMFPGKPGESFAKYLIRLNEFIRNLIERGKLKK